MNSADVWIGSGMDGAEVWIGRVYGWCRGKDRARVWMVRGMDRARVCMVQRYG